MVVVLHMIFLYNLNIGPQLACPLCGLTKETADHILWSCRFTRECWLLMEAITGINMQSCINFTEGSWLTHNWASRGDKHFIKALMATGAWTIWKARCNLVFCKKSVLPSQVESNAVQSMMEYSRRSRAPIKEFLTTLTLSYSVMVLCDASWTDAHAPVALDLLLLIMA